MQEIVILRNQFFIRPLGTDVSFDTKVLLGGKISYVQDFRERLFYSAGFEILTDVLDRQIQSVKSDAVYSIFLLSGSAGIKIWQQPKSHFFLTQGFKFGTANAKKQVFGYSDLRITNNDTVGINYDIYNYLPSHKLRVMGATSLGLQRVISKQWSFNVALEFIYDLSKPNQNKMTLEEFQTGNKYLYLERYTQNYNQTSFGLRLGFIRNLVQ